MVYERDFSDSAENDNKEIQQINGEVLEKQTAKERFNNMRDI
jgi:hypothetical protein